MRHTLMNDVNVNISVDIPKQDVEDLIDKITDSAIIIISTVTVGYIVKSIFSTRN